MRRDLGHEGCLGHAGLRIDFQYDELARTSGAVVISKVGPAYAATAQRLVRLERQLLDKVVNIFFKIRRKYVDRSALGIFGVVVVPTTVRGVDFDDVVGL